MKPVKQTIIYNDQTIGNGDCVTACWASILELPLWCVPPFHQMYGRPDYNARIDEYLKLVHRLQLITIYDVNIPAEFDKFDLQNLRDLPEFYVATGPTVRGGHHAVVYGGDRSVPPGAGSSWQSMWGSDSIVHDPHSSDAGLTSVWKILYLRPLAAPEVHNVPDIT